MTVCQRKQETAEENQSKIINLFIVGAMNSDRANLDGCGFSKFKVLLIICEFTATECSWSIADFVYQYYFFLKKFAEN